MKETMTREPASKPGLNLPARVSAQEAYRYIEAQQGALLDVRGFDEFAAGHAAPALCIPLPDLERRAGQIPTDRPVFVLCASGQRSRMAAERLRALGFDNIVDIEGGLPAWERAGLPVQKQRGVIPLERQVRGVAGAMVFLFALLGLTVHTGFLYGALFVGFMLFLSAVTGLCPMLSLLKRMPWNRVHIQPAS
jgi:rhodanese-related sulfurtransferase